MTELSIINMGPDYVDYLRDESRKVGSADSISFPRSEAEVIEIVTAIAQRGEKITIQGARTGIVAGAVPSGGHILNLSRLNAIGEVYTDDSGNACLKVGPGAILDDIRKAVAPDNLFFPPDPTETSASIGGMVSCNASGALSFFYGPTSAWVNSIRLVTGKGSVLSIKRGEHFASNLDFTLNTETGETISGALPIYTPPSVKSAAGYFCRPNMDMIDVFIGMEGTLGVITEIELKLINQPAAIAGLTVFFPSEESALSFVAMVRDESDEATKPVAIEFFNYRALELLRKMKDSYPAFADIPAIKEAFHTAIYVEYHGDDDDQVEEKVMPAMEAMEELGVSDEDTWFATSHRELAGHKAFRHAIPEAVNLLIDERKRACPDLTKLGTDMSVPNENLNAAVAMYEADLASAGLDSVIFGHIGNNHLHVNILPNSMDEYAKGKELYFGWAKQVVEWGGSISAEHGIGKIKAPFLKLMYGEEGIAEMRALKKIFDPNSILNPGNLFDTI